MTFCFFINCDYLSCKFYRQINLKIIKNEMQKPSFLLEHVAGRIGQSIFNQMPKTDSIDITISKINPPIGADIDFASVELHLIGEKPNNTSKF